MDNQTENQNPSTEGQNDPPIPVVVQSSTFSDLIMPCSVETPACTHPDKCGIITIKATYKQWVVCESCYNYMIAQQKWVKSTWG